MTIFRSPHPENPAASSGKSGRCIRENRSPAPARELNARTRTRSPASARGRNHYFHTNLFVHLPAAFSVSRVSPDLQLTPPGFISPATTFISTLKAFEKGPYIIPSRPPTSSRSRFYTLYFATPPSPAAVALSLPVTSPSRLLRVHFNIHNLENIVCFLFSMAHVSPVLPSAFLLESFSLACRCEPRSGTPSPPNVATTNASHP